MLEYTESDRRSDFQFFIEHNTELFAKHGHKFLAIKNKSIIGVFDSPTEAIISLSGKYKVGTYIIQECSGDESAYMSSIMRLRIRGQEWKNIMLLHLNRLINWMY